MVFFIVVLRALSACLITNAHYTGIYPTDLIANGGLIGDILFFAISGYCLFNVKKSFPSWYGKRLYRIYPPVILITAIYFLIGSYSFARGGGALVVCVSNVLSLCCINLTFVYSVLHRRQS